MHRRSRSFGTVIPRGVTAGIAAFVLLLPPLPMEARTRKGDRLLGEARVAESKQEWDKAVILASQAMTQDPSDPAYQLEVRRVRFEAGAYYVSHGQEIRAKGRLQEAMESFRRAYEIDPASDISEQEIRRTKDMIDREKKKATDNVVTSPEMAGLTPVQEARRNVQERVDSMLPVPELRPLNSQPIILRMNNQKPRVLYDTVGKLAGINVLFDPEYDTAPAKNQSIDLNGATLQEALDYVSLVTHSFWKPLAPNTIFVTTENPTKRREYEDQVVKVFYLSNVTSPQELQEVITTLRQVIEVNKLFNYSSQNAIIVRAEPDRMALVEKIIADLDKPKAEVLVDVMVMEVNTTRTRQLAAAFAPTGINSSVVFTPRTSLLGGTTTSGTGTGTGSGTGGFGNNGNGTGSTGGTGSTTATTTATSIALSKLAKIDGRDYSLSNVPGALLQAVLTDSGTRVLQRPEIRAVDNFKAILKIGNRIPTATGSFQPGVGGVGINPLVNTQFTYIDTGVNLEVTPRVHDNGEVSLHLDIDVSQVSNYVDLGGIQQPVISQRKSTLDVRMKDGQINMIGGLLQLTDTKTVSGIPGLAQIPFLKRLFSSEEVDHSSDELLISITPHIVRGPEINESNLRAVYAGDQTNYRVRYAPRPSTAAGVADGALGTPVTPAPVTAAPAAATPAAPGISNNPNAPNLATARVTFFPGQLDAQVGSSFTVAIRADSVTNLQSIESQIKFDPKILKINSITSGDLLQQNGLQLQPQRNILNDSGDASATLARDPAKGSVSGSGALLVVTFQAVGAGSTLVTMPKTVLHDATGTGVNASGGPLSVTVK